MKVWVTTNLFGDPMVAVHTSIEETLDRPVVYGPFEISIPDPAPEALRAAAQVCAEVVGCDRGCAHRLFQLAMDWEHGRKG